MIHLSEPDIGQQEAAYVMTALTDRQLSAGKFVDRLEAAWAERCRVRYAVACANGTAALHLNMLALEVGPGQDVIVPAITYIATANAVTYCGGRVRVADIDPLTWTITPATALAAATPQTVGIIAVHLYGQPADMPGLRRLCQERGWWLAEDAAEAHGATLEGRPVGGLGDMAAFSFYGNKIVAAGEGGMALTDDDELAQRLRHYRGQAVDPERHYWHTTVGYNYRIAELPAAVALAQTERLAELLARRAEIAGWYRTLLPEVPGTWQRTSTVHWLAVGCFPSAHSQKVVATGLAQTQIETRPVFPPLHWQPPYRDMTLSLPAAEDIHRRGLCLPLHTGLTQTDVKHVATEVRRWLS